MNSILSTLIDTATRLSQVGEQDLSGATFPAAKLTLCEQCFLSETVFHQHSRFCCVKVFFNFNSNIYMYTCNFFNHIFG